MDPAVDYGVGGETSTGGRVQQAEERAAVHWLNNSDCLVALFQGKKLWQP